MPRQWTDCQIQHAACSKVRKKDYAKRMAKSEWKREGLVYSCSQMLVDQAFEETIGSGVMRRLTISTFSD